MPLDGMPPGGPAMPGGPGAGPPGLAAPAAQQPQPFGASPATASTPDAGYTAAALAFAAIGVKYLQMAQVHLPFGSEVGRDIRFAIDKIEKHIPAGSVNAVQQQNAQAAFELRRRQQEQAQLVAHALAARQMGATAAPSPAAMSAGLGGVTPEPQPGMAAAS